MSEQASSKLEKFKLDPASGRRLALAAERIGELRLLDRLWPLWRAFADGPWRARCFAADATLRGRPVEIKDLLVLGPTPRPNRPNLATRWAIGQMLTLARLQEADPGRPMGLHAVAEVLKNIDAPQMARRAGLSALEGPAGDPPPAAAVWSLCHRWVEAGLAPLVAIALALAAWEREGPNHNHRSAAGRVLVMGLATRLGLPAEAFNALAAGMVRAAGDDYDLASIIKRLRSGRGWRWWLGVFMTATQYSASLALEAGLAARELHQDHKDLVLTWVRAPRHPLRLLELFIARPVVDLPTIAKQLQVTQRTAGLLAKKLLNLGLIEEITGQRRGRRYAYSQLIEILNGNPPQPEA